MTKDYKNQALKRQKKSIFSFPKFGDNSNSSKLKNTNFRNNSRNQNPDKTKFFFKNQYLILLTD
jgi:hypothetical protein